MIAKGLDFPNVTLVGVVNADVGLHMPDFRSAERTFQLLSQVAGRTGRGPRGGRVLVQTFNPEHPCIALAAAHDYVALRRPGVGAPAGTQLSALPAAGPGDRPRPRPGGRRATSARRLAAAFHGGRRLAWPAPAPDEVRLLGPAEAPVFRLKGYYRFHFQLQSPSPGDAAPAAARGAADTAAAAGRRVDAWTSIRSTCCEAARQHAPPVANANRAAIPTIPAD